MPQITAFDDLPIVQGEFKITKIKKSTKTSKTDAASDDLINVDRLWIEGIFKKLDDTSTPDNLKYQTINRVTMNLTDSNILVDDVLKITAKLKTTQNIWKGKTYDNISLLPIQYSNESKLNREVQNQFKFGTMAEFLTKNVQNIGLKGAERIVEIFGTDARSFMTSLYKLKKEPNGDIAQEILKLRSGKKLLAGLNHYILKNTNNIDPGLFQLFEFLEREMIIKTPDKNIACEEWSLSQSEWTKIYHNASNHSSDPAKYIMKYPYEALAINIIESDSSTKAYGSKVKRLITANHLANTDTTDISQYITPYIYETISTRINKSKDSAVIVDQNIPFFEPLSKEIKKWMYSNLQSPHETTINVLNQLEETAKKPLKKWPIPKNNILKIVDNKIMTKRQYAINKDIVKSLKARLDINKSSKILNQPLVDPTVLKQWANEAFAKDMHDEFGIENASLDQSQLDALALSNESNISIITGGPGTGKTSIIKYLIKAMLKSYNNDLGRLTEAVNLMAPTGKASKRMSQQVHNIAGPYTQSQLKATTIHKRLQIQIGDEAIPLQLTTEVIKEKSKVKVIIIDEASMIDEAMMATILAKIAKSVKIIIIGDVDQIPSISYGCVLRDLINSNVIPTSKLDITHRNGGVIAENAKHIRNGESVDKWNLSSPQFQIINSPYFAVESTAMRDYLYSFISQQYLKLGPQNYSDFTVLCPYRREDTRNNGFELPRLTTDLINRQVQNIVNPNPSKKDTLTVVKSPYPNDPGKNFYVNDYIINTSNFSTLTFESYSNCVNYIRDIISNNLNDINSDDSKIKKKQILNKYQSLGAKEEGIFNGDTAFIHKVMPLYSVDETGDYVQSIVAVIDGLFVPFIGVELENIDLAYAITIHKAQGSEFKNVLVIQPKYVDYLASMTSRELLYTAVTRAKSDVKILGEIDSINMALDTRSTQRITILADLLAKI